jgi:hypothetical protein
MMLLHTLLVLSHVDKCFLTLLTNETIILTCAHEFYCGQMLLVKLLRFLLFSPTIYTGLLEALKRDRLFSVTLGKYFILIHIQSCMLLLLKINMKNVHVLYLFLLVVHMKLQ